MKSLLALLCWCFLISNVSAEPIQITDSHGKQTFVAPPQRVVVINWTLAEQVLELGITPVAIADKAAYTKQVAKPAIPAEVVDVGLRAAPNLKKIKNLKPDVIIIGYSQRPLARALSNIAPVVYFNNFSKRYHNEEKARARFLELAKLFGKTEFAKQKLVARDARIAQLKAQLAAHYRQGLPKTSLLVIDDNQHAWVFGENSMPQYALQMLGATPAISQAASKFGVSKRKRQQLGAVEGCLLFISYTGFDPRQSSDWQSMPAMQNACFLPLAPVPLYGGAMSIQYLAEAMVQALLRHSPPK